MPIAELIRETCKDETVELHNRLEVEPGLLAGDQMNEASPRTWLLLKREMPITNPSTGTLGFSLDFLYVDQDGTPTFVEAKWCNDPRARRDIIGQVLEYVANAQAYWQDVDIQQALTKTYESETKATEAIRQHQEDAGLSLADFITAFLQQVRESTVRIVLFLENSSYELRTRSEDPLCPRSVAKERSIMIVTPSELPLSEASTRKRLLTVHANFWSALTIPASPPLIIINPTHSLCRQKAT